jgi:beta-glucanase (GH16 family)
LTIQRRPRVTTAVILGCFTIAWPLCQRPGPADHPTAPRCDPLLWQEDFTGPAGARPNPANWRILSGDREGQLQYYTRRRRNVSLDGAGHLVLTARREDYTDRYGGTHSFTSGSVETKGRFSTKYGRVEASIKIPPGQGLWSGFWALGSDYDAVGWPESGEIDVMENLGQDPYTIYGSIHGPELDVPDGYAITNEKRSTSSLADGFHIYGVRWTSAGIVFELDRASYATVTPASLSASQRWVFDKPFFMILNLSVGGWPGPPDATTPFPARLLVDWVRAYR